MRSERMLKSARNMQGFSHNASIFNLSQYTVFIVRRDRNCLWVGYVEFLPSIIDPTVDNTLCVQILFLPYLTRYLSDQRETTTDVFLSTSSTRPLMFHTDPITLHKVHTLHTTYGRHALNANYNFAFRL
jgi:hypothetical protein